MTDDQLDVLVEYMDTDHDGLIDYQEFLDCFSGKGAPRSKVNM